MLNTDERSGVLHIEMNHGKVNALDLELLQALTGAFRGAAADQAIVVSGAGKAFSAGVDLLRIRDGDSKYAATFLDRLSECFLAVFDHPGPVVAAIDGAAIAGGCVIAAACDRRIMSRGPIGLAELAVGVPFPTSALEIMRSVLGPRTRELVLTARAVDAQEALAVGLVDEVVPTGQLLPRAFEQAVALRALPPGVFTFTKRQVQGPARERISARGGDDDAVMKQFWASPDVRAAVARYMAALGSGDHGRPGNATP